ncbi:LacI family DNA-binding transcriptional regulator [Devosia geojensis]|uniref:LacI family DNA-binding transcriptional regulator n=1 Tax=Devosia geojensis TaxID=443610 RepID=UPI0009FE4CC6|nr:LacI family DNA-binding transcriptional regulator [Devosia geojensis]
MTKAPTASDVARRAEVSRSAVSLVLGGNAKKARLSDETQERIRKAAKELNYRPNAAGRSLVRGRTETIGLVIRDLDLIGVDPFLLPLLKGILEATRDQGYRVLVESIREGSGDPFGDLMDSGRIDGMIVENPNYGDKSLRRLIKSGRPVVVMGSQGLKEEVSVRIDDFKIGFVATEHLISLGRRRIAHIAYAESGIYAVDLRFRGYVEAMRKAGLPIEPALVTHANFSMESGYAAMLDLLGATPLPDAIFATSDAVAMGAMAAVQDAGYLIPRDIAVASVDDISAARFFRPALTTVTSEPYASGKLAAEMLIELMSGQKPGNTSALVDTRLIVRGSSVEDYSDDLLQTAREIRATK